MSYEIYIVGTPGTPSFSAIVQELSLPPAQPNNPTTSDLTVSGSLVGGTIQAGGDLNYDVVGATPNELAIVCLSDSNVAIPPLPFFNLPLGIGGGGSFLFFRSYGVTDAAGNFSAVDTFAPAGGIALGFTIDLYAQAVTLANAPTISLVASSISDVEGFQINF
ncbi:MAG: hypothetical protein AB8H80_10720 [Planctomycetota bacterium]